MSQLVTFGPFSLFPRERRLEHGGQAVKIGSRALDILIALTERAGEVVSREALVARIWPDTIVVGFFSLEAVAAMAVGVDADQAVDTLGDLPDEKAIVGRIS